MGDTGLPEFQILWILQGFPIYAVAVILQVSFLGRRRRSWSERRTLLIAFATFATACVVGSTLRETLPVWAMDWPGNSGAWPYMFLGIFFIPGLLATATIFPLLSWAALRSTRPDRTTR